MDISKAAGACLLLAAAASPLRAAPSIRVDGTRIEATLDDGRQLRAEQLVGAILGVADAEGDGTTRQLRIDAVATDPRDPRGELLLYDLKLQDGGGLWQPYCNVDPYGQRAAMFLAGGAAGGFRVTCTAGAIGKCIRLGYRPWATLPDGRSLAPWHDACTQMMRAAYCGDGRSYTEDGTLIDIADRIGIQRYDNDPGLAFEAAWSPAGAVCVAHTRKPALLSIEQLQQRCPRVRTGADCSDETAGALLYNRSRP